MFPFHNFHLSSAMTYILHSVFSIIIGALVSFLVYIGSNAFTGTADLRAVLLSGLSCLVIYFTTHIGALVNSPQAIQARADGLKELEDSVMQLATSHQNLIGLVNGLLQQQAPAPTPQPVQPAPRFTTPVPQSQFAPTPIPSQAGNTYPYMPAVQQPAQ